MTTQTEKGMSRWTTSAALLTLLIAGWVGGAAFFTSRDDSQSGSQGAKTGSSAGDLASEVPAESDVPDEFLSPLGGLIGGTLHQGSLNIGLLADAVEGKLYTRDEGRELLSTVSALVENAEDQISKLPGEALHPDDRRCLERFRAVIPPLKTQIVELRLFWDTEDEAHAERFQKARTEAQTALHAMLRK